MEDDDESAVDALSSLRAAIGPGDLAESDLQYPRRLLGQVLSGASRRRTDETYQSLDKDAQAARQALQDARQRLLSRPAYDQRDKWLAVGAQLIGGRSPSGRFGDGVADAASALLRERGVERQALDQRAAQELTLAQALNGVDSEVNQAKRTLALKREELDSNMARSALAALRRSSGSGKGDQLPMSIKEWREFLKMTPQEQERYLIMKRASVYRDVNEIPTRLPQLPGGPQEPMTTPTAANAAAAGRKAAEASGSAQGKAQGEAAVNLPGIIATNEQNLEDVKALRNHPGLKYLTGLYSAGPIVPGTDQAAAFSYQQKLLDATFLEAFNSLRGGGQITEAEGRKATGALTRLGTKGLKMKDYQTALDDLAEMMTRAITRAKRRASAPIAPGMPIPDEAQDPLAPPSPGAPIQDEPSIEDLYNQYGEGQ